MEALSLNLKLLQFSGILEPPIVMKSQWKRWLFSLYMITSVVVFIPVLMGELLAVYHFWGDLVVITNNIFTMVGNITFYGNALYIISRRKAFMHLVSALDQMLEDIPRWNVKQQMITKETIARSRKLTWSLLVIIYLVPVSWSVAPVISMLMPDAEEEILAEPVNEIEEFWRSLISIMWLPLDATQSPIREIVYTCQFIVFVLTASYYTSVNTVFVSFIVHISGQFEILISTIYDMDKTIEKYNDPYALREYFVNVISHHQSVIAFAKELNDVLSPLLFFYFMSAQVMMCVMAFQMVLTWGEQNNFLKFFFGLLCVMAGPFFFCWQGNVLIDQSLKTQQAVYGCEWYERNSDFKKMTHIVITRAQRPIRLTAGTLYPLSLESFAKMLNSVYYYFAVLKQLHEE
ncbi:hypothetical protein L9F63_016372 [Diploptera punctata]|uniref:Odorant receptor n=1 Tax=Diploptera punctata TaxID=6984 RepID=A0AAD8A1F1_DIPPU|nr:hypothetical protein L9F63_016372 [Diploptera punctata]